MLHSVPIARHERQAEGEADFVVIIPNIGVLVVEVKSHTYVSYADGLWRLGNDAPTKRSPVSQATNNMYSIKSFLEARTDLLEFVPVWRAVWFTNIERAELAQLSNRVDVRREDLLGKEDLDSRVLPGRFSVCSHTSAPRTATGVRSSTSSHRPTRNGLPICCCRPCV